WREKNQHQLESGETLLTRILKARRVAWEKAELDKMKAKGVTPANDKWKLKYEEPVAPETTDLPELPEGWVWASLNQFAAPVDRAIQSGPFGSNLLHSEFQSEGKLVIGIDNVRDGWFSPGSQNRISDEKFEQLKKYAARPKDFLITVMATVGRTCVLPEDIEPAIITKHVYRFTLDQDLVIPEFVNLCVLGSPSVRAQMFGNVRGQTRPGLNKSILTQFGFPLPSLEEQRQILDQSAELTSQISENRKGLVMQTRLSNALRHSVLQTAFCGGLVSQNAADEPASELLERIAAERSEAPAQPQRGRKSKTQEPA
ncbi:MAG: restriction endonuclease subunit S, partial [Nevskia sp.]|nr:restriction endonuclease subunit S [Nevskia sp.]